MSDVCTARPRWRSSAAHSARSACSASRSSCCRTCPTSRAASSMHAYQQQRTAREHEVGCGATGGDGGQLRGGVVGEALLPGRPALRPPHAAHVIHVALHATAYASSARLSSSAASSFWFVTWSGCAFSASSEPRCAAPDAAARPGLACWSGPPRTGSLCASPWLLLENHKRVPDAARHRIRSSIRGTSGRIAPQIPPTAADVERRLNKFKFAKYEPVALALGLLAAEPRRQPALEFPEHFCHQP